MLGGMAALLAYWQALPADKPRTGIDPLHLGAGLLGHVSIGHVVDAGRCIRYDLIGGRLKAIAPRLSPGALSSDPMAIEGTCEDMVHDTLCDIARKQELRVIYLEFRSIEDIHRQAFELILPLGLDEEDQSCSDLLIGVWDIRPRSVWVRDRYQDLTRWFLNSLSQDQ